MFCADAAVRECCSEYDMTRRGLLVTNALDGDGDRHVAAGSVSLVQTPCSLAGAEYAAYGPEEEEPHRLLDFGIACFSSTCEQPMQKVLRQAAHDLPEILLSAKVGMPRRNVWMT